MAEVGQHHFNLLTTRAVVAGSLAAGLALSLAACGGKSSPDIHGTVVNRLYTPTKKQSYEKRVVKSVTCTDEDESNLLGARSHHAPEDDSEENDTTTTKKHTSTPEEPEKDCVTTYASVPPTRTTPARYTLTIKECESNGQDCSDYPVSVTAGTYYEYPLGSYYPANESPAPLPSPSHSAPALPSPLTATP